MVLPYTNNDIFFFTIVIFYLIDKSYCLDAILIQPHLDNSFLSDYGKYLFISI